MSETVDNIENNKKEQKNEILGFLKVDTLKRGSHALNLMLRNEDVIVGINGRLFRGTQKTLNQELKLNEDTKVITIFRKNTFLNIKAYGPLGIKLLEVGSEESEDLISGTEKYLKNIENFNDYKEFEVYKGAKNFYDILEVNDSSLLASLLPFIWFYHHRLFSPLLLLIATFLLLGSIAWWLLLSAWVITTLYMSKSSMSLLRSYCLFHEMKPYLKIFSKSSKEVQEVVRSIDKKSNYRYPFIEPAVLEAEVSDSKEDSKSRTKKEAAQPV